MSKPTANIHREQNLAAIHAEIAACEQAERELQEGEALLSQLASVT